jgi:D-serine deaminase-like pyridoxal phosphate-dependent protein
MSQIFEAIEKPTLLLDEAAARRNIQRMLQRARKAGVSFRPHFKTHQSIEIGEWFRALGVTAITVSSLDMAQYFASAGWTDITIAFPINLRQRRELAALAQRIHLGLLVESEESVRQLAAALDASVDIWIKVDVGGHRTGIAWDQSEQVAQLARYINSAPALRLRGLLTHASQTYGGRGKDDVCRRYTESVLRISGLRDNLHQLGIGPLAVSVGDTPGTSLCADLGPVDEIRPGNFVFYDTQQLQIGSCLPEDIAVALACPVVALHPERSEIIVYGGAIHLSKDFMLEGDKRMYGWICLPDEHSQRWGAPLPGAYVSGLSQEHGILHIPAEQLEQIHVGDLVCILPAHSCLSVTLMKRYLTLDGRSIDTMNV